MGFLGSITGPIKSAGGAVVHTVDHAVDGVEDGFDAAADALAGGIGALSGGIGAAGDAFVDGVTHMAVSSYDLASIATKTSFDVAKWGGARGGEMIGQGTAVIGPAISMTAHAADLATLGIADEILDVADDTILDTVDSLSGGIIDVDYDDGGISANVGIDGVAGFGASIGEDGIAAESNTLLSETSLSLGENGLTSDSRIGIDQFPLPYVESHIGIDEDGNVSSNQVVQAPYPIGDGIAYGKASGGFEKSEDGWAVKAEVEGTYYGADGTQISGAAGMSYAESGSDSSFSADASGSFTNEYGTVGAGVSYDRIEKDGDVLETFGAEASAKGFGVEASAEANYVGIETDEGSVSVWDTDADLTGLDLDKLADLGGKVISASDDALGADSDVLGVGDDIGEVVQQLAPMIEDLGSSDAATAIGGLHDDEPSSMAIDDVGLDDATDPVVDQDEFSVDQMETAMDVPDSSVFDAGVDAADSLEESLDDLFEGLD